ncbi:MAG TPA: RNase P subunit p30 family protein [Methanomicrobiales archaeon]|nr:RNase P subunit p30 family protein [Methanomicrobiales archaeon]
MPLIDGCIHPYPAGDSSLRRMALEARELGFDQVVAAGGTGEVPGVLRGNIISASSVREVVSRLQGIARGEGVVMVNSGDLAFNRGVIGLRGVRVLRGIHLSARGAFNYVAAREAEAKGVAVELDLSPLIGDRGIRRQRAISRYRDLLDLHRRYHFPLTLASNARSILGQRSVRDIVLLARLFGMEEAEVTGALSSLDSILAGRSPVQVVRT